MTGLAMFDDIEPMYTEAEAAGKLGLKPRQLREERRLGRIAWKPVAGRIMYRHSELVAWQRRGECLAVGLTKARNSSNCKSPVGAHRSGTFDGAKMDAAASVQRARQTAERLSKSTPVGSSKGAEVQTSQREPARVIPMRSE